MTNCNEILDYAGELLGVDTANFSTEKFDELGKRLQTFCSKHGIKLPDAVDPEPVDQNRYHRGVTIRPCFESPQTGKACKTQQGWWVAIRNRLSLARHSKGEWAPSLTAVHHNIDRSLDREDGKHYIAKDGCLIPHEQLK